MQLEVYIPISIGELLDKITILSIKLEYTNNNYIKKELEDLINIAKKNKVYDSFYISQLLLINKKLWKVEDDLRIIERDGLFDDKFIQLARSVYINNDIRSSIKKEINQKYNSSYREVKLHK